MISQANALAVRALEGWRDWPQRKLVLTGPPGAGKTHLVHVWAAEALATVLPAANLPGADIAGLAGARVAVEDADTAAGDAAAERALFHLHNLVLAEGGTLLLTARTPPARWPLGLPDLASRLQGTALAAIAAPDDALLAAVLAKLFADRQMPVPAEVLAYAVARVTRSFAALHRLAETADALSLAEKRPITVPLLRRALDIAGTGGP